MGLNLLDTSISVPNCKLKIFRLIFRFVDVENKFMVKVRLR